jgi:tetratricopeptide (TPR) repeat protein|tara:strand:- start:382 stop:1083 length:702 start_codon:yes stop_codon:yes gene_type:complete
MKPFYAKRSLILAQTGHFLMSSQTHISQEFSSVITGKIDLAPEIRLRLRQLIDSLPDEPARLRVLGHVLLDLGLCELGLNAFGRALILDDLDAATHMGLTRTYMQIGRREIALEHLEIAISLRPDSRELRVLAADLLGCRNKMRALDQLGAVLGNEPDHAGARKGLANLVRTVIAGRLQSVKEQGAAAVAEVSVETEASTPTTSTSAPYYWYNAAEPFGDVVQSSLGRARYVS